MCPFSHKLVLVLILAAFATSVVRAAPDTAAVLQTLRPGHPRLLVLAPDVARAKQLAQTDPTAKRYRDELYKEGEKVLGEPAVEYKLEGPRLLEESRRCLRRVYTLGALYRLDGDRKWADRAKKELFAAAAFPDWNPSHFLDTVEMTHAFAIGYDWMYDAWSDRDRAVIRRALVEKGLERGREAYEGTKPWKWWTGARHNWNQVCNGGLLLGALAVADEEPGLAAFIVASALKSLPRGMASFAPDGGWNEGPGYWSYTVNYTVALIAGLQSALGSDFGLARFPGFDQTGAFRLYFVGPTRRPFNYADAGDGTTSGSATMYWLGKRFGQPLFYPAGGGGALGLFWYQPAPAKLDAARAPLDRLFRGVDVAFLRSSWDDSDALFVGFKGGDNGVNHSHLDLGTFVFDALGERWATDLGSDNYNLPGYFGKQRWTYYRLRTEGQNTLTLDGQNQNLKAKAPVAAFAAKPDKTYAVANLTEGYTPAATRVLRGVALVDNRRSLLVQDEIAALTPVEYVWGMHTRAAIQTRGNEATLTLNGKTLAARVLSPAGATFEVRDLAPIRPGSERPSKSADARKLVVRLPDKIITARVAVLLTPQKAGQVAAPSVLITPLEDWIKTAGPLPPVDGAAVSPSVR